MDKSNQLRVKSFESSLIQIEITDFSEWKKENTHAVIKIGSFLKVEDGNNNSILCLVKSFKMAENKEEVNEINSNTGHFIISTQPIGSLVMKDDEIQFRKGVRDISIPPNSVSLASEEELKKVFSYKCKSPISFSTHQLNREISIEMNGDKLFSKHLAVVGSTGSGKSCTVTKIIQQVKKSENELLNNSHILIFDIHGEYEKAFPRSNYISIEKGNLKLPYWLMNSEELEDLFIESSESNSHNQVSQFKHAVIQNKKKHNPKIGVTYDSPVFFSLTEVYDYIKNKNKETHYNQNNISYYAILEDMIPSGQISKMWKEIKFEGITGASKHTGFGCKVTKGNFYGEFERFISRLETKMNDDRLSFILNEDKNEGDKFSTTDFLPIFKKLLGYEEKNTNNITIIDLSSLPFEIVSIVVSIISRLLFDFSYFKTKMNGYNSTPYMVVYEEAHKYVPKTNESKYKNTRVAVERIAKEGRKYGLSAMVVSQRPSELSSTVFSQCNNFIIMRLTNPDDQSYVKRLLPEAVTSYGDDLSSLEQREALLVGDSLSTPCVSVIGKADPTPKSDDVEFYSEWMKDWENVDFTELNIK